MNQIKPGLYEAIITQRLSDTLKESFLEHERAKLAKDDATAYSPCLSAHLYCKHLNQ